MTEINTFKLPIVYSKQVKTLDDDIIANLELVKCVDDNNETPIYTNVFKPSNKASTQVMKQQATYYTTDLLYLKETQQLTKQFHGEELNTIHTTHSFDDFKINEIMGIWDEIKGETGFCEKYLYIHWDFAKHLNTNSQVLQLMCMYNIASPILSLCLPILVLIIPFIVIKMTGTQLNITQYIEILKTLIANNSMFKIFTKFHEINLGEKLYLFASSAFYLFSIYQNILVCLRFYSNMQRIHVYLDKFKKYIAHTTGLMDYYRYKAMNLTTYVPFCAELEIHHFRLSCLYDKLDKITPFSSVGLFNLLPKMSEIGHIMTTFYHIYDNPLYNETIVYSFGFNGYVALLSHVGTNVAEKKLCEATYVIPKKKNELTTKKKKKTNEKKKPIFKQMYYPKFIDNEHLAIVKNDCDLNTNIIITGPNASGKTTTLKTAFINILLSQQIGFGCFEKLIFTPFTKFHCYLNIPDTSCRDSLFQAEARRCKEIIDCITDEPQVCSTAEEKTHFCIFDELYSGTNPEEAVISSNAFMNYIVGHSNVTCMLTTHYNQLCKQLAQNKRITNYHMKTTTKVQQGKEGNKEEEEEGQKGNKIITYTYQLKQGISNVKGGLKVLRDMKYPKEILDLVNSF